MKKQFQMNLNLSLPKDFDLSFNIMKERQLTRDNSIHKQADVSIDLPTFRKEEINYSKLDIDKFESTLQKLIHYKQIQHLQWSFSQMVADFYLMKQRLLKVSSSKHNQFMNKRRQINLQIYFVNWRYVGSIYFVTKRLRCTFQGWALQIKENKFEKTNTNKITKFLQTNSTTVSQKSFVRLTPKRIRSEEKLLKSSPLRNAVAVVKKFKKERYPVGATLNQSKSVIKTRKSQQSPKPSNKVDIQKKAIQRGREHFIFIRWKKYYMSQLLRLRGALKIYQNKQIIKIFNALQRQVKMEVRLQRIYFIRQYFYKWFRYTQINVQNWQQQLELADNIHKLSLMRKVWVRWVRKRR